MGRLGDPVGAADTRRLPARVALRRIGIDADSSTIVACAQRAHVRVSRLRRNLRAVPSLSAGLLLYRAGADGRLEVLVAHMGGPFWARRDAGAWSIPKGEYLEGEDPLAVARREFEEELGQSAPEGKPAPLGEFRQSGGKRVTVFAQRGDCDVTEIRSNHFSVEWPPRSGQWRSFPEVDRAEWTEVEAARERLVRGQVPALDALLERLRHEAAEM